MEIMGGFGWRFSGHSFIAPGSMSQHMEGTDVLVQVGPFASPPALLVGLVLLLLVVLVARILLALAWRLVLIAVVAVFLLWLLAGLGLEVFAVTAP